MIELKQLTLGELINRLEELGDTPVESIGNPPNQSYFAFRHHQKRGKIKGGKLAAKVKSVFNCNFWSYEKGEFVESFTPKDDTLVWITLDGGSTYSALLDITDDGEFVVC